MEDYAARLESAGYSRDVDAWVKTAHSVALKVVPQDGGFEIRGTNESESGRKKTQEMTLGISGWENLRAAEESILDAFSETPLADSSDDQMAAIFGAADESLDMDEAFKGLDFDRVQSRTFAYEAMDQSGREAKGDIDAATSEDALAKLRNLGYFPTRIRERGPKEMALEAVRRERQGPSGAVVLGMILILGIDRIVKWCRGRACTLLLAGAVMLGMILILA